MSSNIIPADQGRKPPGILVADAQGRPLRANTRWVDITGVEPALNSQDGWLAQVHPDDREWLRAAWSACLRTGRDFSARIRLAEPSPTDLADVRVAALPGEKGEAAGFIVMLEEDAEARPDDAAILQARKMEAVGRLASGLAHDFANLLTLISGYTEILLGRVNANDPLRPELDEIRKAANRGSGLTGQLLAFSRRQGVEPQVLDLNALVTDMQTMLRRMIGENIDLSTHLSPDLGSVRADPGQLEQVIMNLAINARDAMPRGGEIAIHTANIHIDGDEEPPKSVLEPGRYVMLRVTDTGEGMNAETLRQVFDPFFTTKGKGHGTGLGLATVYGIVKQGRGDIQVWSEPGKGTTFTIYLPHAEARKQPAAAEPGVRATDAGSETILLVEDEDGVRRLLHYVLTKRGYRVLEAAGGPAALALYEQLGQPVDLLLTDIVMPGMSGRELADRMVKLQPGLRVIFMSGYTDEVVIGVGGLRSPAAFLSKPLRPDAVAACVRDVLDAPPAPADSRTANCATTAP